MNMLTEFKLIGRVGEIREVGSTLRVSVASSFSRRDNSGEWIDRTRWNELTIFGEATRGYNIVKGDLIFTSGSLSQTKWEKDGETFYGVTLACEQIESACPRGRTALTLRTTAGRRRIAAGRLWTTRIFLSETSRNGEALVSPPFLEPVRRPVSPRRRWQEKRWTLRIRAAMEAMNLAVRKPTRSPNSSNGKNGRSCDTNSTASSESR